MIQIGVRGSIYSADEKDWAESVGIRIVHIEEFFRLGPDAVAAEARRIVGDGPAYLTFDVDGLDPSTRRAPAPPRSAVFRPPRRSG